VTKRIGVVGKIDTSLEEGLKIRNNVTPKTFEDKKWDANAACCFEGVQLFDDN
jgi:hypothetical protein